ncbi:MAG: erythromycin esterase family protein, partial [Gemmatimonadota bacterium]
AVRFVPLVGRAGWGEAGSPPRSTGGGPSRDRGGRSPEGAGTKSSTSTEAPASGPGRATHGKSRELSDVVADSSEAFDDLDSVDLDTLLDRIGDARLVLLGEASHGTSEFYRMRARITRELIERKDFDFVAAEADWPDAAELDAYVRHHPKERPHKKPFQRFPRWMWANTDVLEFVHWLRGFNEPRRNGSPEALVGFHGMDLYSMHASMEAVIHYLEDVDPEAAEVARERYGCLAPWQNDPVLYGRAVLSGRFDECEDEVMAMLRDLLEARMSYIRRDGNRFVDAIQNARLVANAERYYRSMYRGSVSSWNLRDQHMFETLELLLSVYGAGSRGVVWAHNSHLGNAAHTEMGERGEHNVGQLCREEFGDDAYLVGFGTHTGTVAAASDWDEPMEVMEVQASHPRSYERVGHDSGVERFLLPLRNPDDPELRTRLEEMRLERAIGVIYRPRTELQSHYFRASLPNQFDEWIWFDESEAVTPIGEKTAEELEEMGLPDTYPFGV